MNESLDAPTPSTDAVLGAMLACATGLVTVCGALVVYSSRLAFLWEPRSLVLALGVATGAVLCFTLVDLMPEAQSAFEDVARKMLKQDDEAESDTTTETLIEGYASLMLAGAFSLGAVLVWGMDTLCLRLAAPAKPHRSSRDPTMIMRNGGSETSPSSFGTRSTTRNTTNVSTRRRGQTLVLPSNTSDLTTNELLYKTSAARVVAFAVQSIPEGMVLCIATHERKTLGILFASALSMLNVTQGMAFAGLLTQSSGLRWRAVLWCVLAALALPLGGLVAWAVTMESKLASLTLGVLYGATSGMLVAMSLAQTLMACYNHKSDSDDGHVTTTVLCGIAFTAAIRMMLAFVYL